MKENFCIGRISVDKENCSIGKEYSRFYENKQIKRDGEWRE